MRTVQAVKWSDGGAQIPVGAETTRLDMRLDHSILLAGSIAIGVVLSSVAGLINDTFEEVEAASLMGIMLRGRNTTEYLAHFEWQLGRKANAYFQLAKTDKDTLDQEARAARNCLLSVMESDAIEAAKFFNQFERDYGGTRNFQDCGADVLARSKLENYCSNLDTEDDIREAFIDTGPNENPGGAFVSECLGKIPIKLYAKAVSIFTHPALIGMTLNAAITRLQSNTPHDNALVLDQDLMRALCANSHEANDYGRLAGLPVTFTAELATACVEAISKEDDWPNAAKRFIDNGEFRNAFWVQLRQKMQNLDSSRNLLNLQLTALLLQLDNDHPGEIGPLFAISNADELGMLYDALVYSRDASDERFNRLRINILANSTPSMGNLEKLGSLVIELVNRAPDSLNYVNLALLIEIIRAIKTTGNFGEWLEKLVAALAHGKSTPNADLKVIVYAIKSLFDDGTIGATDFPEGLGVNAFDLLFVLGEGVPSPDLSRYAANLIKVGDQGTIEEGCESAQTAQSLRQIIVPMADRVDLLQACIPKLNANLLGDAYELIDPSVTQQLAEVFKGAILESAEREVENRTDSPYMRYFETYQKSVIAHLANNGVKLLHFNDLIARLPGRIIRAESPLATGAIHMTSDEMEVLVASLLEIEKPDYAPCEAVLECLRQGNGIWITEKILTHLFAVPDWNTHPGCSMPAFFETLLKYPDISSMIFAMMIEGQLLDQLVAKVPDDVLGRIAAEKADSERALSIKLLELKRVQQSVKGLSQVFNTTAIPQLTALVAAAIEGETGPQLQSAIVSGLPPPLSSSRPNTSFKVMKALVQDQDKAKLFTDAYWRSMVMPLKHADTSDADFDDLFRILSKLSVVFSDEQKQDIKEVVQNFVARKIHSRDFDSIRHNVKRKNEIGRSIMLHVAKSKSLISDDPDVRDLQLFCLLKMLRKENILDPAESIPDEVLKQAFATADQDQQRTLVRRARNNPTIPATLRDAIENLDSDLRPSSAAPKSKKTAPVIPRTSKAPTGRAASGGSYSTGSSSGAGRVRESSPRYASEPQTVRASETAEPSQSPTIDQQSPAHIRALDATVCRNLSSARILEMGATVFANNVTTRCFSAIPPAAIIGLPTSDLEKMPWSAATEAQVEALSSQQLFALLGKIGGTQCSYISGKKLAAIKSMANGKELLSKACNISDAAGTLENGLVVSGLLLLFTLAQA